MEWWNNGVLEYCDYLNQPFKYHHNIPLFQHSISPINALFNNKYWTEQYE